MLRGKLRPTLEEVGALYRAGYYPRTLVTRVGKPELRVPQGRAGRFSTARCSSAISAVRRPVAWQGCTCKASRPARKVITEELCGHSFSAAAISAITAKLDEDLAQFAAS